MQNARDVEIKKPRGRRPSNHLLHSVYKWMDHTIDIIYYVPIYDHTCSLEKG